MRANEIIIRNYTAEIEQIDLLIRTEPPGEIRSRAEAIARRIRELLCEADAAMSDGRDPIKILERIDKKFGELAGRPEDPKTRDNDEDVFPNKRNMGRKKGC